jgi:hypothetical protein
MSGTYLVIGGAGRTGRRVADLLTGLGITSLSPAATLVRRGPHAPGRDRDHPGTRRG